MMKPRNLEKIHNKNKQYANDQRSNYSRSSIRDSLNSKRLIIGSHKKHETIANDKVSTVTADKLKQLDDNQREDPRDDYLTQEDQEADLNSAVNAEEAYYE